MTCLENLIGLAPSDCPCFEDGYIPAFSESRTGYFMTDKEYGLPISDSFLANVSCLESDIWDMMTQSLEQATDDFKTDLAASIASTRRSKMNPWNGSVGTTKGTLASPQFAENGVKIIPVRQMKGASFVVTAILTGFDYTGILPLVVKSHKYDFATINLSLQTQAGVWKKNVLDTPIVLPFYSPETEELSYAFAYETAGKRYLDNKTYCCGNSRQVYEQHFKAGGYSSQAYDPYTTALSLNMYGLVIEGYLTCASLDWLCSDPLLELSGYPVLNVAGRAIQAKATVKMLSGLIDSNRVNAFTLLSVEEAQEKRTILQQSYVNKIAWLEQNIPLNLTDCWECSKNGPTVRAMIV